MMNSQSVPHSLHHPSSPRRPLRQPGPRVTHEQDSPVLEQRVLRSTKPTPHRSPAAVLPVENREVIPHAFPSARPSLKPPGPSSHEAHELQRAFESFDAPSAPPTPSDSHSVQTSASGSVWSRRSSVSTIYQPNPDDEARTAEALRDAELALQQLEHTQKLEEMVADLQNSLEKASEGTAMQRLRGAMKRIVKGRLGSAVETWRLGCAVAAAEDRCRAAEIALKDSQKPQLDVQNLMSGLQKQQEDSLAMLRAEFQEARRAQLQQAMVRKGMMDRQEFLEAGGTNEEFDRFDTDGNGQLDRNELKLIADQISELRTAFEASPKDTVSREELAEFAHQLHMSQESTLKTQSTQLNAELALQQVAQLSELKRLRDDVMEGQNKMVEALDKDQDGMISKSEYLNGGGSESNFEQFDADRDGVLNDVEVQALVQEKLLQAGANPKEAQREMENRQVSLSDLRTQYRLAQLEMLRQMDKDKNGSLDRWEFVEAGGSEEVFDEFDRNGDGKLDMNEVQIMAEVTGDMKLLGWQSQRARRGNRERSASESLILEETPDLPGTPTHLSTSHNVVHQFDRLKDQLDSLMKENVELHRRLGAITGVAEGRPLSHETQHTLQGSEEGKRRHRLSAMHPAESCSDRIAEDKCGCSLADHVTNGTTQKRFQMSWFFIGFLLLVWLGGGAIFYNKYAEWDLSRAILFAVSTGMGLGFGDLVNEGDSERVFTAIWVPCGMIVLWMSATKVLEAACARREAAVHEIRHQRFGERIQALEHEQHFCARWKGTLVLLVLHVTMIGVYIAYGLALEDWTGVRSLYFAMTAAANVGLQDPSWTSDRDMWVLSAIILCSVVIYFGFVIKASCTAVELQRKYAEVEILSKDIVEARSAFSARLLEGHSLLVWSDFLQLVLLHRGLITEPVLDCIRKLHRTLDVLGDGQISRVELNAALAFEFRACSNDGEMPVEDFARLLRDMGDVRDWEDICFSFRQIDFSKRESIQLEEFMAWFRDEAWDLNLVAEPTLNPLKADVMSKVVERLGPELASITTAE